MNLDRSDPKGHSVVEPVQSASTNLQDAQGIDRDCALHTLCGVSSNLYLCPERLVFCEGDTTSGDAVALASSCGESAEPSHEGEATTVNASDVEPTDEPIASGDEPLVGANKEVAVPEDYVDHDWIADDSETATMVVLPDPPSANPALSSSEMIALAEPDTKPSHSETTPETLYITLLSPGEVHEQRVSYLVGELPKVAVMVPHAEPQITNQGVQIQEEREAEQAAEKIEAEREELERSGAYIVGLEAVGETKSAPVPVEDESIIPVESVTEGQL